MILLVAGVSRSGKSTLAKKLCRQRGMSYLPLDSLISTLESLYPDTGIRHMDDNQLFSPELARLLARLSEHLEYEDMDFVLDPYQLFPVDYMAQLADRGLPCVYLGYPHLTAEEKLKDIRRHQREQDWTQDIDDAEMIRIISQFIAESKLMAEQCQQYGLPFFDMGKDFKAGIERANRYIQRKIIAAN